MWLECKLGHTFKQSQEIFEKCKSSLTVINWSLFTRGHRFMSWSRLGWVNRHIGGETQCGPTSPCFIKPSQNIKNCEGEQCDRANCVNRCAINAKELVLVTYLSLWRNKKWQSFYNTCIQCKVNISSPAVPTAEGDSLAISSMTTIECMNAVAIFLFGTSCIQMENICHSHPQGSSLSVSLTLKWVQCKKASGYNRKTHHITQHKHRLPISRTNDWNIDWICNQDNRLCSMSLKTTISRFYSKSQRPFNVGKDLTLWGVKTVLSVTVQTQHLYKWSQLA